MADDTSMSSLEQDQRVAPARNMDELWASPLGDLGDQQRQERAVEQGNQPDAESNKDPKSAARR